MALASKKLEFNTRAELILANREQIEENLEFNGFLITGCELKEDAIDVVKALQDSSHYVTMITGDALLTALHVARVTQIAHKEIHLLERDPSGEFAWRHADEEEQWVDFDQFGKLDELGMTGAALTWLLEKDDAIVKKVLPRVRVFARTSPTQKEHIIIQLKAIGFYTVMCGDGTNDVGALKHAHIGVALLSSAVGEKLEKQREIMQKKRQVKYSLFNYLLLFLNFNIFTF